LWDHNRFAETRPEIRAAVDSPYIRGGVTGVGVITALAGLFELAAVIPTRSRRQPQQ